MTRVARRLVDLAISVPLLALAAPLLVAAAVAIRLHDRGPILFRQSRVGRHGEDFDMLKLRTMEVGAVGRGAGLAIAAGDSRITPVGRLLRRTSLDELPNLVNVARGEMSIVGPRPTLRHQVETYTSGQRRRLEVKPGITGWAQIHGRASLPWSERIELDLWYVDHQSLALDLRIIARTPALLLRGVGLYKGSTGGWGR
ncbi:MAG: sugar transferase [Solirubrobacterales bacterium]